MSLSLASSKSSPDSTRLLRRLLALSWQYRRECLTVFGFQVALLALGISGLGLSGVVIDVTRAALRDLVDEMVLTMSEGIHGIQVTKVFGRETADYQRFVCFARAMLADPRILILDEATSSVDAVTEARLQRALSKLLRGRTSFVVAHRLSTIRHADLVLVLDRGQVVERGTHVALLARDGRYAQMYRQFVSSVYAGS
jgi:ABC-type protease/lipase transport system fused ATPase/permease subunit